MPESYFSEILPSLPSLLTRKDISKHFGTLISKGYLANLDSLGKGPKKIRLGQKVVYKREDFVAWLDSRAQAISTT